MQRLKQQVEQAQLALKAKFEKFAESHNSFPQDCYIRLLSTQYHLNKDVQRDFLIAASHPDLARRRKLRKFLCEFANEEELHYLLAENDLKDLGATPLPCPFDVELWKAYFGNLIYTRPFIRLGACAILENILTKSATIFDTLLANTPYLNKGNTRYIVIHKHEQLPHGDAVLSALEAANLEESHLEDLATGALKGSILFLRLLHWGLFNEVLN